VGKGTILSDVGTARVVVVAISDNESQGVAVHDNGTVSTWILGAGLQEECRDLVGENNVTTGKRKTHSQDFTLKSALISVDGKLVVWGRSDNTVRVWSFAEGKEVGSFEGHSDSIRSLAVTTDARYVISGSCDKTVKIWSIEDREKVCTFSGHSESVHLVAVTADGKYVISGSADLTMKVWSLEENSDSCRT